MVGYVQMHHVLGISDERSEEIAYEVMDALTDTGSFDEGTKKLAEKYDAGALLAGMRLMQAIALNQKMQDQWDEKVANSPKEVQAFNTAFGGQNASQN